MGDLNFGQMLGLTGLGVVSNFLGGALGGESDTDKNIDYSREKNARARGYLGGYGYESYKSPYEDFFNNLISTYGSGTLTAAQEKQLDNAYRDGASSIATVMANRGGTIGGQLAATEKLNNNLADQRLTLSDSNTKTALDLASERDQLNLSDWLQKQMAEMRRKELLAQYS